MKRASYSKEFKAKVVKEAIETGNKSMIARRYVLSVGLVHRWVVEYESGKFQKRRIGGNVAFEKS
ncbi:transposase [Alkalihalobacterium chitinilyticum]|uniref:Transposase n=1 Tax=Alkalihalobacterium chitinilyticum TaxID=2980103 RepID=A0ABT5VLC8_9BACI|nr:transposase [Alkalihalobacterium chitinilyticum]MDE5416102.1 transposase [Alkalihalobacterium chitinilyticum]